MATLSTDSCTRPDQSGLGTASDGESYTINGTITTSIASNEAVVSGSGTFTSALLGTQTTANINFLVRVEQTNNNFDGVGPCWRSSANGQNCYFVAIYSGNLLFAKLVSNGFTQLASTNVSEVSGTFYWIRVSMTGNHLQARVWADGSGEPGTWNIDTTDATYSAAGHYGMSFNQFSGSGVKFDSITVTDGISGVALTATLAGTGALSDSLSLTTALTGTLNGDGVLNPTLSATAALSATMVGAGTLDGTINEIIALSGDMTGVGTLSGTMQLTTALSDTIDGTGTLDGTMALATSLNRTLSGSGALIGSFSLAVACSLTCAAAGALIGHLSIPSTHVVGLAIISDTSHGSASIGDVLVDQVVASDVAAGSVTISDQG